MDFESWDDLDQDRQYALGRAALAPLTTLTTGTIKENRSDEKLYFGGKYLDRTFRVLIDMSWGKPVLEVKIKYDGEDVLLIYFDRDAQPVQAADADPEWEEDDDPKTRHFLAPGVYIEERRSNLEKIKGRLVGLSSALIAQLMQMTNASILVIAQDKLEVTFDDRIWTGDITPRMRTALDYAAQITRELGA